MPWSLGKILASLRHEAGLSQEELADRAGLHRTYISQLERGLKSPTVAALSRIAKALGTKASKILKMAENAS